MQKLRGTGVALVTPFTDQLEVDVDGLIKLVRHVIDGGVDYLVVMGTTAENVTLTKNEKDVVLATVKSVNTENLPIVLGLGGNNTHEVILQIEQQSFDGVAAILSVSPYYNKPSQEGIYQHYSALSMASPVPILLYNVPGRTGSNMSVSTVMRLANDFSNIIGIKEAAGDMDQVLRMLKERPEGFLVISGDDLLALPLITAGGDGVISVIGQGLPSQFTQMVNNGLQGNNSEAYKDHFEMIPIIDMIFEEGNPAGIKSLLNHKRICGAKVRLPLVEVTKNLDAKIKDFLN